MDKILKDITQGIESEVNENKLTLTLKECSIISQIGLNTLQEEVNRENTTFPFFKIGKKIMVDKDLFKEWLKDIASSHKELRK